MKIKVEVGVTRRYKLVIEANSETEAEYLVRNMSIEDIEADGEKVPTDSSNSSMTVLDATRVKA